MESQSADISKAVRSVLIWLGVYVAVILATIGIFTLPSGVLPFSAQVRTLVFTGVLVVVRLGVLFLTGFTIGRQIRDGVTMFLLAGSLITLPILLLDAIMSGSILGIQESARLWASWWSFAYVLALASFHTAIVVLGGLTGKRFRY